MHRIEWTCHHITQMGDCSGMATAPADEAETWLRKIQKHDSDYARQTMAHIYTLTHAALWVSNSADEWDVIAE